MASVMGKNVAKTGPICRCTSLTITNWLAQIRLQTSRKVQSRRRAEENIETPQKLTTRPACGRGLLRGRERIDALFPTGNGAPPSGPGGFCICFRRSGLIPWRRHGQQSFPRPRFRGNRQPKRCKEGGEDAEECSVLRLCPQTSFHDVKILPCAGQLCFGILRRRHDLSPFRKEPKPLGARL